MTEERILTLHPDPEKSGVNIDKRKYESIRSTILESISSSGELAFKDLAGAVYQRVGDTFEGSISWCVTTIKLDLEARGVIERIPKRKPQMLRMVEK